MRPVDKSSKPLNEDGTEKSYTKYKYAKSDLIEALGCYCSYCEMNIENQPDIEHVIPVTKNGDALEWSNFLLSCKTCNTIKNNNNDSREGIPFPDEYNTAYLYNYENGEVKLNSELLQEDKEKAQKLFDLVSLNRKLDSSYRIEDRFNARKKAFDEARESLNDYLKLKDIVLDEQKENLLSLIQKSVNGFFSVWLEVFKEYPEVKKVILERAKGTAFECYDSNYNPIPNINRS